MDADLNKRNHESNMKYNGKIFNKFLNSDAKFLYYSSMCNNSTHVSNKNMYDSVLGSRCCSKIKFPLNILLDYVQKFDQHKYLYKNIYNKLKSQIGINKHYKNINDLAFFYGIDETFLTRCLKPYLNINKIIYMKFIFKRDFEIGYLLDNTFKNAIKIKIKRQKFFIILLLINLIKNLIKNGNHYQTYSNI